MNFRLILPAMCISMTGCSLVTVPVKTAGSIVTTTVKTTGDIVTAPFDAVGRGKGREEPPPPPPAPPQVEVRRAETEYVDPQRPAPVPSRY
ncbi:MAG: hypothetical protein IAE77_16070 [Prosthecobacter sp.]|jgi:hypothetical protein|uniref:hypothetical protein n=1 Tax=Prosthecobacter sp. TaxID=1965333 RepID=UPI0019DB873F|nr:hypothetical protein [Prosthecobacter sp.]MBE2284978.1 hypothetical protein [Prosthecobacter sp.]